MPGVVVYDPDEAQCGSRAALLAAKLGDGWPIRGHYRRAALLRGLAGDPQRARDHVVALIDLAANDDDTHLDGLELIATIVRHPELRINVAPVVLTSHVNAWVLAHVAELGARGVIGLQWLHTAGGGEVTEAIRTLADPRPLRRPQVPVWPDDPALADRERAEERFALRFAAWSGGLTADAQTYELVCQLAEGGQQTAMRFCGAELREASRRLKRALQSQHGVDSTEVPRLCRQFLAETGMRRPRRRKRGLDLDQVVLWATSSPVCENAFLDRPATTLLSLLVDAPSMREQLRHGQARSERQRQERLDRVLEEGRQIVRERPALDHALAQAGVVDVADEILRIFDVLAKAAADVAYGEQLRSEAEACDGEERERLRMLASACGA